MVTIIVLLCAFVFIIICAILSAKQNNKLKMEFLTKIKNKLNEIKFVIDKEIKSDAYVMFVDDHNKKICLCLLVSQKFKIIEFKDIIKYDIVENNESITKGRAGSAVVGGVLFGGLGAIAGASRSKKNQTTCTNLAINLYINDLNMPIIKLVFLSTEVIRTSFTFKTANEQLENFASVFNYIINQNEENKNEKKKV